MKKHVALGLFLLPILLFLFISVGTGLNNDNQWISFGVEKPQKPIVTASTQLQSSDFLSTSEQKGSILVTFLLPGITKTKDSESNGWKLEIPGGSVSLSPGAPRVPSYSISLALPPNTKLEYLEILDDETEEISGTKPAILIPHVITPKGIKDLSYEEVELTGLYPREYYKLVASRMRDGNSCGTLVLYPIQYNPETKKYLVHKNLTCCVHFSYRGYTANEIQELFIPKALEEAQGKFGWLPKLDMGTRQKNSGVLKTSALGDIYKKSFLVEENGASEFSLIAMSNWFEEAGGKTRRNAYGLLTYNKGKDRNFSGFQLENVTLSELRNKYYLQLSQDYGNITDVYDGYDITSLIESEWQDSPGLIVFKKGDKDAAAALAPLASYLNWPLFGVESTSELAKIERLINKLNSKHLFFAGEISKDVDIKYVQNVFRR